MKSDSQWLNCWKGCNWWVYSRCQDNHYENSDTLEKRADKWAKDHYFCQKYMPREEPVSWDVVKGWALNKARKF